MRYNRILLVLSCCLLILASLPLLAATQNAVVYGTVYDATGNPLPGVTVNLDNPALGFSRTTTTGSDGSYNFAEVPPAEGYSITALKEGRKIDIRSGIVVNVGDERVIFPPLKEQPLSASAAEPTARKAEGAAVTSETVATNISGVISGDQLRTLPLYNRNFLALGGLTPNVHDLSANNELAGASFSVNGQRGSSNNFLLDGADNVASTTNQAVPFQVNDAIQEFRVISANAPAEYGRGAGGVVNVVTRRGSNAFHGSAFGYFANDALNSNNPLSVYTGSGFSQAAAFAGSASAPGSEVPLTYNSYVAQARATGFCTDGSTPGSAGVTPAPSTCTPMFDPSAIASSRDSRTQPFDSRQFGVNLGGPIVKDKLFAFGSYEATLINNPTPVFERVPLPWDTTYSPFGAGSNPQFSSSDPNWSLAKNLLSLYPAANVVAVPNALGFFQGNAPNWTNVHNFLFRTDWIKSEKTSVSLRYALQKLSQLHDDTLPQQSNYPGNGAFRDVLNHNFALTWTHSLSARTINEMRVGFSRFALGETPQDSGFDPQSVGLDMASMPMFQTSGIDPQLSGAIPNTTGAQMGWTNWYFSPAGTIAPTLDWRFPFARLGAPLGAPLSRQDQAIFGSDSVSLSMGKHNFKLGAEIRHQLNVLSNGSYNRGFILSNNIGEFTHDAESCNGSAGPFNCTNNAFLRPSYSFAEHGGPVYHGDFHNTVLAGFAQDTWRVGSRVTLSYGLRYEYWTLPWEDHNSLWNYSPDAIGLVKPGTTSVSDPYNNTCNSSTLALYPWRSVPDVWVPSLPAIWNCHAPTATGLRQAYHAFAPRVGLAWDLFGTGKTVLRVGGGLFDDQRPVSDIAQLMYNQPLTAANGSFGQFNDVEGLGILCPQCGLGNTMLNSSVQSLSTLNPAFPNSFFSSVTLPQAVYARDIHHTSMPYSAQFDLTLQQQLNSHAALEIGYVGSRGQNLPVIFNPSQIEELFYANLGPSPHGVFDFSPIFTMTNQGESQYHSLMTRLRVADWHGLRMDAAYSWSRSMDNASTTSFPSVPMSFTDVAYGQFLTNFDLSAACVYGLGGFCSVVPSSFPNINFGGSAVTTTGASAPLVTPYLLPQSQSNFLSNDRSLSDFDARHRFVLDYAWEIPTEQWHWPNWANHWSVSGIFTAQSGQPFTIFSGPVLGEFNVRASATGPVRMDFSHPNATIDPTNLFSPFAASPCNGAFYFGSFASPSECLGNTRRNQFIGPNYMNMDLAVHKGFQIGGEGHLLTFTTEFFNLFDRANYYNPVSTLTTDGTNFNPDFGKIKSAHGPRQIQFAIRYTW